MTHLLSIATPRQAAELPDWPPLTCPASQSESHACSPRPLLHGLSRHVNTWPPLYPADATADQNDLFDYMSAHLDQELQACNPSAPDTQESQTGIPSSVHSSDTAARSFLQTRNMSLALPVMGTSVFFPQPSWRTQRQTRTPLATAGAVSYSGSGPTFLWTDPLCGVGTDDWSP
jgi:hypothetical protein